MKGSELKQIRESKGVTQPELAEHLGVSVRQIGNFEKEKTPIKEIYVEKISTFFGLNEDIKRNDNQSYTFDVLNVKASAGNGVDNFEVEVVDNISLDKMFFKTPPNTNKTKMIEVVGDSMIPTLLPGDFVLIDESKIYSVDGIYAIQMNGQIFIKRLQFNLDGTIDIISDNPKYTMKPYDPNDTQMPLNIIGMKTLSIQR